MNRVANSPEFSYNSQFHFQHSICNWVVYYMMMRWCRRERGDDLGSENLFPRSGDVAQFYLN